MLLRALGLSEEENVKPEVLIGREVKAILRADEWDGIPQMKVEKYLAE